MQAQMVSSTGSNEPVHYGTINRDWRRERSMSDMRSLALNDLNYADPQTCSNFADFCAERLSSEITVALCLSLIHGDNGLRNQALAELRSHVDKCQPAFLTAEVERRIDAAGRAAQAHMEQVQ